MARSDKTEILSRTADKAGTDTHLYPVVKPKPAGTLLILDEQNGKPHVLMGRRHSAHKFMPDVFVFPGGRVDRPDNHAPYCSDLTEPTLNRLMISGLKSLATRRRARAFALAAIRETFEEVGMLIGQAASSRKTNKQTVWAPFLKHGQIPDLAPLRYVARAVTPPGLIRRYDTRFFTAPRSAVSYVLPEPPTDELNELSWVPFDNVDGYQIPKITRLVLNDVTTRIAAENTIHLRDDQSVPIYTSRYGRHTRHLA